MNTDEFTQRRNEKETRTELEFMGQKLVSAFHLILAVDALPDFTSEEKQDLQRVMRDWLRRTVPQYASAAREET